MQKQQHGTFDPAVAVCLHDAAVPVTEGLVLAVWEALRAGRVVDTVPAPEMGEDMMCWHNVRRLVERRGGELVLGWSVCDVPLRLEIRPQQNRFARVALNAHAVWLHGGAFNMGSGSWPMYDGLGLASRGDAVVVTVNHRLGPFGYLNLANVLGGEYAQSGNAGMLDIVLALNWVSENIERFGGDPRRVLVFGNSGGASKTSVLLGMPAAQGLIHRAAIMSGPYPPPTSAPLTVAIARRRIETPGSRRDTLPTMCMGLGDESSVAQHRIEKHYHPTLVGVPGELLSPFPSVSSHVAPEIRV